MFKYWKTLRSFYNHKQNIMGSQNKHFNQFRKGNHRKFHVSNSSTAIHLDCASAIHLSHASFKPAGIRVLELGFIIIAKPCSNALNEVLSVCRSGYMYPRTMVDKSSCNNGIHSAVIWFHFDSIATVSSDEQFFRSIIHWLVQSR